jgi:hypothetical protein
MVTAKPDDKKNNPPRIRHSGHGAASLIPHLKSATPLAEPAPADPAGATVPTQSQPGAPVTQNSPQPE